MFSEFDRDFMARKMKIVVDSIESKLNDPLFSEIREIAIDSISKYVSIIVKLEASGVCRNICSGQRNDAEKFIDAHFCEITLGKEKNHLYQVLDTLRHAFVSYAANGLHQLYTRQENESWYPEIKLSEILEPNDIKSLPDTLILYRGCDIGEFEKKIYGQAWTTSLEVAEKFAYSHYQDQDWFDVDKRVILKAICSKENVLFSDQSVEFEVVVNEKKLNCVQIHK